MSKDTLYSSPIVKVLVDEQPDEWIGADLPFYGQTTETRGVVYYDVMEKRGGEWLTYAQLAAPMFDAKTRSEAACEALRLADEADAL